MDIQTLKSSNFGCRLSTFLLCSALLASATQLGESKSARAFDAAEAEGDPTIHAVIVKDALSATLNHNNINLVVSSLEAQESDKNAPVSGMFTQPGLRAAIAFIDREQKKVIDYAALADTSAAARYHALKHFGQLLSVAQDFYSRSNYLEVESEIAQKGSPKAAFNPYNLDLVDWTKLISDMRAGKLPPYGPATQAKENEKAGAAPLGTSTYYKAARELAVRESVHQWELIESLIRRRYRDKATTIVAALKEASAPDKEPESLD